MATDLKTIELPEYAVKYLNKMCEAERKRLIYLTDQVGMSLQITAAYDALNTIESAI